MNDIHPFERAIRKVRSGVASGLPTALERLILGREAVTLVILSFLPLFIALAAASSAAKTGDDVRGKLAAAGIFLVIGIVCLGVAWKKAVLPIPDSPENVVEGFFRAIASGRADVAWVYIDPADIDEWKRRLPSSEQSAVHYSFSTPAGLKRYWNAVLKDMGRCVITLDAIRVDPVVNTPLFQVSFNLRFRKTTSIGGIGPVLTATEKQLSANLSKLVTQRGSRYYLFSAEWSAVEEEDLQWVQQLHVRG